MDNLEQLYRELSEKYSDENLKTRARDDAARNIPRPDFEESSPFEIELVNACQTVASKVASEYRAQLEELDGEIKADRESAESAVYDELNRLEGVFLAKRQAVENNFEIKEARVRHDETLARFNQSYNKVGRLPNQYVPVWLFGLLTIICGFIIVILNAGDYQLYAPNPLLMWTVSALMGISIPIVSLFIGVQLREEEEGSAFVPKIKGVLAFGLSIFSLFALAKQDAVMSNPYPDLYSAVDALSQNTFEPFWFNCGIMVVLIVLTFLAYDSVPAYHRVYREYASARLRLRRLENWRTKKLQSLELSRVSGINFAKLTYRDALAAVTKAKGHYDQILKKGQEQELRCLYQLGQLLSVYRQENISCREDKLVPKGFSKKLDFPLMLSGLSEKLINEDD